MATEKYAKVRYDLFVVDRCMSTFSHSNIYLFGVDPLLVLVLNVQTVAIISFFKISFRCGRVLQRAILRKLLDL